MSPPWPTALLVGAVAALLVAAPGCGGDSNDGGSTSPSDVSVPTEQHRPLPPNDIVALAKVYDPMLEPYDLRVTRGGLVDRSGGGYEPTDDGTHLALYVEPTRDWTTEDYLAGAWDVPALLTPDVFERYSDLESYDICLEPVPFDDGRPDPPPVTQLDISREVAAELPWDTGTLADLIAAGMEGRLILKVNDELRALPGFTDATTAAAELVANTSSTAGG